MGFGLKRTLKKIAKPIKKVIGGPITLKNPAILGSALGPMGTTIGATANHLGNAMAIDSPEIDDGSGSLGEFDTLAAEEERRRQELAQKQRDQIYGFADEYGTSAAERRSALATSLADLAQRTFEQANPFILEDLNSRGLFTSPSAVAGEQTNALKDLSIQSDERLNAFDTDVFNEISDIKGTGLSTLLGGDQDALDAALDLRRQKLGRQFDVQDQAADRAFAEYLAKRQSRDNLINSLIGGGSSIAGGILAG